LTKPRYTYLGQREYILVCIWPLLLGWLITFCVNAGTTSRSWPMSRGRPSLLRGSTNSTPPVVLMMMRKTTSETQSGSSVILWSVPLHLPVVLQQAVLFMFGYMHNEPDSVLKLKLEYWIILLLCCASVWMWIAVYCLYQHLSNFGLLPPRWLMWVCRRFVLCWISVFLWNVSGFCFFYWLELSRVRTC
jgi:hypothetical protein